MYNIPKTRYADPTVVGFLNNEIIGESAESRKRIATMTPAGGRWNYNIGKHYVIGILNYPMKGVGDRLPFPAAWKFQQKGIRTLQRY